MPIYEYRCEQEHVTEVIVQSWREQREQVFCAVCNRLAPLVPSVPAMQPDDYWNGGRYDETLGKRFNSRKEHRDYMKKKGIEPADSGVKSVARLAEVKKREKQAQKRRENIAQTVRDFVI